MHPFFNLNLLMSNILIADDSEDLLEMLAGAFKRNKLSVITANNKLALHNHLQRIVPEIIIINASLENDDGRQICKELKQNKSFKNSHIILMSGDSSLLENYADHCADDVLAKPFTIEQLLNKIKSVQKKTAVE
jgi:DNA-binding response OmpR family regulator